MILIRFSRGTGLAGALVRFGTFSEFAHVGFKLDDGKVLDATPEFGVSIRDAEDDETTVYMQPLAPGQMVRNAVEYAKLQVGKPYDWIAIFGMCLRRDWHKDTRWFCSELVCGAFDHAGWSLVRDSNHLDRITPQDLFESERLARAATPR